MYTATKTGIDAAKTTSKRVVEKTAEATDLIGNKIADKITLLGKSKNKQKEKKDETNEVEEIYFHQKKYNNLLMT